MSDFTIITPRLATGGAINVFADVEELYQAGIRAVIDCRVEFDDDYLLRRHSGITYIWNGTADDGAHKPVIWFQTSVNFALDAMKSAGIVYAHCAAGVNRGPSTAFMIMLSCGWSAVDAERIIRAADPRVGLAYKSDALEAAKSLGYLQ